ncbi:type IV secretion protein Rhs [Salmonella enterica]|nr:type IV secretion protein Rhs [Salmonella enterica]
MPLTAVVWLLDVHHDEGLYVESDRRVTAKGNQEHTTKGDHLRLVKGMDSLEVKGDLARKVSGALGYQVRDRIVLTGGIQLTLKVKNSFVAIHAGGVDIVGPKINLNSGGSAGIPVPTRLPGVLQALAEDDAQFDQNDKKYRENTIKSVCKECLKKAQEAAAAFAPRE